MILDTTLLYWSIAALVLAVLLVWRHWRSGSGIGLLLTYVLSFGVLYWVVPTVYLLPWYDRNWHDQSVEGLKVSTLALVGLSLGAELALRLGRRHGRHAPPSGRPRILDERVANVCAVAGILLYAVVTPMIHGIASLTAVASTGSTLVVAALVIKCWDAWHGGSPSRIWRWLLLTTLLPLATIIGQGFLGYGFAAMLTVFAFVASIYRPRWKVVVLGLVLAYLGMSVYVTYMRDRPEIRRAVWGGADWSERADQMSQMFDEFEWFNLHDYDHLDRLDDRLNQDSLLGAAVIRLRTGQVPFARGRTLLEAAAAMVPRALWPDKPLVAGSGDLVSEFTGMRFSGDTSVGIGHVMESYVNFGTTGVIISFIVIGCVLVLVDEAAGRALRRGDPHRFVLMYVPGLSLLMIGGSFVELTSSAAAALILAMAVNVVTRRRMIQSLAPLPRPE